MSSAGGAVAIAPVLQGAAQAGQRTAPRDALVDDIVNTPAITAIQSQHLPHPPREEQAS
ncbi:MAG TPA: hypothetical protein VHG70_03260 [Nocardioidaceae bacterium]|nr:hypothetical protein [Nocardioidaceae bacterium]